MDFNFTADDYHISAFNSPLESDAVLDFASIVPSVEEMAPQMAKKATKVTTKHKVEPTDVSEEELYLRRKAQNRAAQRAFRERKEGKLKELSGKLEVAEKARLQLEKELDDIKQKNILLGMENQYLQQSKSSIGNTSITSQNSITSSSSPQLNDKLNTTNTQLQQQFKFPSATKSDFILGTIGASNLSKHQLTETDLANDSFKVGSSYEIKEQRVLTISAVWDYLMEFLTLNEDLDVDVSVIMVNLRGKEVCHGFGPAYPLDLVNQIIMDTINDEPVPQM